MARSRISPQKRRSSQPENFSNSSPAQDKKTPENSGQAPSPMSAAGLRFSELSTDSKCTTPMRYSDAAKCSPLASIPKESSTTRPVSEPTKCLKVPCQERIYVFLDRSPEVNKLPLQLSDGTKVNGFERLKKVVRMFAHNKTFSDSRHRYGLIYTVGGLPTLVLNNGSLINFLQGLWAVPVEEETKTNPKENDENFMDCQESIRDDLDLGSVFGTIAESEGIETEQSGVPNLNFVIRVILFVTRSRRVPSLSFSTETGSGARRFLARKDVVVDVVYLHDHYSVGQENQNIQEIFETLLNVTSEQSYIFEMGPNVTALHNGVAKLLLSPCLRPKQPLNETVKSKTPDVVRKTDESSVPSAANTKIEGEQDERKECKDEILIDLEG